MEPILGNENESSYERRPLGRYRYDEMEREDPCNRQSQTGQQYEEEPQPGEFRDQQGRSRYSETYNDIMSMLNQSNIPYSPLIESPYMPYASSQLSPHLPYSPPQESRLATYFDRSRTTSWSSLEGSNTDDDISLFSREDKNPEPEPEPFDLPRAVEEFLQARCQRLVIRKESPNIPSNQIKRPVGHVWESSTGELAAHASLTHVRECPGRPSFRCPSPGPPVDTEYKDDAKCTIGHLRSQSKSSSSSCRTGSTHSLTQIEASLITDTAKQTSCTASKNIYTLDDLDIIFGRRIGKLDVVNQTENLPNELNYMILTGYEDLQHLGKITMCANENLEYILDKKHGGARLYLDTFLAKPLFSVCKGPDGKKALRSMGWYRISEGIIRKPQTADLFRALQDKYKGEVLYMSKLHNEMQKPLLEFNIKRDEIDPTEDPVERIVGGKKGGDKWKQLVKLRKKESRARAKTRNWEVFYEVLPSTRYFRQEVSYVTGQITQYDHKLDENSKTEWVHTDREKKQFQAVARPALSPLVLPRCPRFYPGADKIPPWYWKWKLQRVFDDQTPHTWTDEPGTHLFNRSGSIDATKALWESEQNPIPSKTDHKSNMAEEVISSGSRTPTLRPRNVPEICVTDQDGRMVNDKKVVANFAGRRGRHELVTAESRDRSVKRCWGWMKEWEAFKAPAEK